MDHLKMLLLAILLNSVAAAETSTSLKAPLNNPNEQIIELSITDLGFQPSIVNADPDKSIVLTVTRKTKNFCTKSISILAQKIHHKLPLNKPIQIKLGKVEPGEIKLDCVPEIKETGLIYVK